MVGLCGAAAAELVPVAVALEGGEVPAVEAVAPRDGVLDCDGGCELPAVVSGQHVLLITLFSSRGFCRGVSLPEVKTVVDVVPQTSSLDDVARAAALLARKAIGALPILARVAVHVRVQVEDLVVADAALHLEPGLVVVVRDDAVKDVVVAILEVDAIGPVDQGDLGDVPVAAALEVEHAAVRTAERAANLGGRARQALAVDGDRLVPVRGQRVVGAGRAALLDRDVLGGLVRAAAEGDDIACNGLVDGRLDRREGLLQRSGSAAAPCGGDVVSRSQGGWQRGQEDDRGRHIC